MTQTDFRRIFLEELIRVAPDIDPEDIGEDDHIQEDLGLDSMDVLNLVTALHARLGVDIPEAEYRGISTVSRAAAYLEAAAARA